MPDDPQPDEGQGAGGSGGLFDSYLQAVPEEHRAVVGGYLADAAKNVNSRLEEAATLRTTYESYQQAGLAQYTPDEAKQLFDWHQSVVTSPDAYQQFIADQAKELGLTVAEQQSLAEDVSEFTPDQVRTLVQELAQAQVAPLQEQIQQIETQRFIDSEAQLVSDRFQTLEREHSLVLTKEQKDMIVDLGLGAMPEDDATLVAGKDWVGAGFDRFREIFAEGQKAWVDDKTKQPKPAVSSSGGFESVDLPKTWKEAGEMAKERLRQSRA